jgi:hypothetical protein
MTDKHWSRRRVEAQRRHRPVSRGALAAVAGLVLAAPLLAACNGGEVDNIYKLNADIVNVDQHLHLKGPDGTEFEISIGKDANGNDVLTATRVGQ